MKNHQKKKQIVLARRVLHRAVQSLANPLSLAAKSRRLQELMGRIPEPFTGLSSSIALRDHVVESLQQYAEEHAELEKYLFHRGDISLFPATGQYDWFDAHVLYSLVRRLRPNVVFEFSPNFGFSTGVILLALERNNHGTLISSELLPEAERFARRTLGHLGIPTKRLVWMTQDCFKVAKRLQQLDIPEIDMLFVDSDHSFEFAQRYFKEVFPLLAKGGLMHIHDVTPAARDNLPFSTWPDIAGEDVFLAEYLKREQVSPADYIYTSTLVGEPHTALGLPGNLFRPVYGHNFTPLSKERNYSFWMRK